MKKLFVFAVAFIAFTGFTFSGEKEQVIAKPAVSENTNHDFSYFRVHRQGKAAIMLNWGITTSAGVSGFTVQRSYDADFFEEINQPACNSAVKFSCKDENVYPGYIYYRIGCIMNDGSVHYSDTEVVRIVSRG